MFRQKLNVSEKKNKIILKQIQSLSFFLPFMQFIKFI